MGRFAVGVADAVPAWHHPEAEAPTVVTASNTNRIVRFLIAPLYSSLLRSVITRADQYCLRECVHEDNNVSPSSTKFEFDNVKLSTTVVNYQGDTFPLSVRSS